MMMSGPPPSKRRRSEDHHHGEASQHNVTFVYRGHPFGFVPRNITHVDVDPSFRIIEHKAFAHCRQLRHVTVPATVETIGIEAFTGCISLSYVRFHKGLKVIGLFAFRNCASLTEVDLPDGITEIPNCAFHLCKSLRIVSLPITVERIGAQAFADCKSLVDVPFPTMLKRIERCAFVRCSNLSAITLPSCLELVSDMAFAFCTSLLSVELLPGSNFHVGSSCFTSTPLVSFSIPEPMQIFPGGPIPTNKVDRLRERFANHPVHRLCYSSSPVTKDQISRALDEASNDIFDDSSLDESSLKDAFEMTPFHTLATSKSLNPEILDCLLDSYPKSVLDYKDDFGNTMMDYLLKHTSPRAVPLLQVMLRRSVVDTVSTWDPKGKLVSKLSMIVDSIPLNSEMDERRQSVKDILVQVGYCCRIETTAILELSIWKTKLRSMQTLKSKNDGDDDIQRRKSCQYQSGAGIVIENVIGYLWASAPTSAAVLSLFPMCSSKSVENTDGNF